MSSLKPTRPLLFFFFSSRRRHTRCSRDWSSDVCSSDLLQHDEGGAALGGNLAGELFTKVSAWHQGVLDPAELIARQRLQTAVQRIADEQGRSEERRVGKEGKWRWWR